MVTTLIESFAIVLGAALLAVAGAVAVRRRVAGELLSGDRDVATAILGILGTLYAVLLAFTVIIVWTHYSDAKSAVEQEANHVGDLSRLAGGFAPADRQRIHGMLVGYSLAVIENEWPAMAAGHGDEGSWRRLREIWSTYHAITPADARQQAIYAESIRELVNLSNSRRVRLHALTDNVPGLMWIVLIAGGLAVVMFNYLFRPRRFDTHAIMVGVLAALIAANLYLVYALDNPFVGWPRLGPDVLRAQVNRILIDTRNLPPSR